MTIDEKAKMVVMHLVQVDNTLGARINLYFTMARSESFDLSSVSHDNLKNLLGKINEIKDQTIRQCTLEIYEFIESVKIAEELT